MENLESTFVFVKLYFIYFFSCCLEIGVFVWRLDNKTDSRINKKKQATANIYWELERYSDLQKKWNNKKNH